MVKVKKQTTYNSLIILIIFLLIVVAILSFTIVNISRQIDVPDSKTDTQSFTKTPPASSLSTKASNLVEFTHPIVKYSLDFPSVWKPLIYKSIAGQAVVPYDDLVIFSPDYQQETIPDTTTQIHTGASILVRVTETHYDNIEKKFAENAIAQKIARNVTKININGTTAIQYDYSTNGENATNVTFTKNGLWYLVKFQYKDEETKRQYLSVFQDLLNSLKLK